jgi:hypothetical protein
MKVVKTEEEEKKTSVNFAKKYFVQIKNNHKNGNTIKDQHVGTNLHDFSA